MTTNPGLTLLRKSASDEPPPAVLPGDDGVAKLIDVSKCIGCKACQAACLEWNERHEEVGFNVGSYQNPHDLTAESWTLMRFAEWDNPKTGNLEWLIRKDGCMHCADPGCLKACPSPGAIVQYANGIVDFVSEHCIGCGYCIKGCPFNIPRMSLVEQVVHKCTLCSDRVAVGGGPACAKACPTHAISFGTKAEMKTLAGERVTDLKSRGFDQAGLYDPPGVGGTHVMYVLHHADQPELYSGLPANPHISRLVSVWKGAAKVAGIMAIGATVIGAFVHHMLAGANRVSKKDEEQAADLAEGAAD